MRLTVNVGIHVLEKQDDNYLSTKEQYREAALILEYHYNTTMHSGHNTWILTIT